MKMLCPPGFIRVLAGLGLALGLLVTPTFALASAQEQEGSTITRDLNSGPPTPVAAPPRTRPAPEPTSEPGPEAAQRSPTPAPTTTGATTAPPANTAVATEATEAAEPDEAAAPPAPPEPAPLTAAQRRALPFRIDLPEGAVLTERRSGPHFDLYMVRLEGRGLLMIYLGPQSEFPIYTGQQINLGNRESIVVDEDGQRLALEHRFRLRDGVQLHVWVSAVSDEDRLLANAIGNTVEPR